MSILSTVPDGLGFYYGFLAGDFRQINVRFERSWTAYVGGEKISDNHASREDAERAAVEWAKANTED